MRGVMRQSPKMPAEKRKEQLIRAAFEIISKKGYSKATTDEIARKAGLTKGALYFHFGNKEEILLAVVKSMSEKNFEALTGPMTEDGDPRKVLDNIIQSALDMIVKKKIINMEVWQQANKIKRVGQYIAEQHLKIERLFTDYLRKNLGMKKEDGRTLYFLLHVIFDGIVVRYQCCPSCVDMDRIKRDVKKLTELYLAGRH